MSETKLHPCVACGACCAFFRVEFYWRETEPGFSIDVPLQLTEDLGGFKKCMKGTNKKRGNQCIALRGRIGTKAVCSVYAHRPSPCRAFTASFSDGKHHPRCDEARAAHGLRPLKPDDWKGIEPDS